jgi:hypothetical protein
MYYVVTKKDSEFDISGKTLMYENTCVSVCSILYAMEFHENPSKGIFRWAIPVVYAITGNK